MTTKAKRKIDKFNFQADNSAVALVSASQGGAANSFKTLVMKSADKFSKEFIEKAQKVQVTMEFDDFLVHFFDMWKEDAKILTSILGFGDEGMQTEGEDDLGVYNDDYFYEWFDEKLQENGERYRSPTEEDKKAWLEYRKQGIELVKSLSNADNRLEMLASLTEDQYWSVLNEQRLIEKASKKLEEIKTQELEKSSGGKPKTPESGTTKKKATKAVHTKEDNKMSGVDQSVELQKALDAQAEKLQKALEQLEAFEQKEKEAIAKARQTELAAVVGDDNATSLLKAVGEVDNDKFGELLTIVKSITAKVETTDMFKEVGSKENGVEVSKAANQADPVAEAFRKRLEKNKNQ